MLFPGATLSESHMAAQHPKEGLEIEQDMDFQESTWRIQRIGWILMIAVVIAAIAGVCGGGPASSAEVGDPGSGMTVSYDRFTRMNARETLDLEISPAAIRPDSTVSVWLDREWMESVEVNAITPEPESTEIAADRIIYEFKTRAADSPLRVRFDLKTRTLGSVRGRGGIEGGPTHSFTQFAYP